MAEADPRIVPGVTITPQDGPQSAFLSSPADIAIYGGGAGGGKTWALLMEPLRHIHVQGFGSVTFRRSTVQIRNEGGLWDESAVLYPQIGGEPKEHVLSWSFPSGASCSFAHLEHDKTRFNWQGSQIPLICFDELTHFSAVQFWYMVSRNRSMCGVRPYIRATCNPDADSWVAELIEWWIDQDTGLPIPERAGVLRWFVRVGEKLVWADSPADLECHTMLNESGQEVPIPPKSLTFIPAKLTDNKALMAADPGYMASLLSLPLVERERLLGGNWKIRPAAGLYFQRSWCKVVDTVPMGTTFARGYDFGATVRTAENPDPDATSSTKIGRMPDGRYIVVDNDNDCLSPAGVKRKLANTASQDGKACKISIPQDPGQAGKSQVAGMKLDLAGYDVRSSTETGDKVTRFSPFSAQAEGGNIDVLRGAWNDRWFTALESFPMAKHDDDADSTSRAYDAIALGGSSYNIAALT